MIKEVKIKNIKKYELKVGDTIYYILVESNHDFRDFYITKLNCAIISFQIGYCCENILDEINQHIIEWICDYEQELKRLEDTYE